MKKFVISALIILISGFITVNWVIHTPHGLYEKVFAVGSSVCHQIPSHSFETSGIQFPLCARCSGLYLGSFIGLVFCFIQGRRKAIPKKGYVILLAVLFLAWAGDGINSFLTGFLNKTIIYETTNITRLITGFGMGLVLSITLMTLFNITVWKTAINLPLLNSPIQVITYFALSTLMGWVLLKSNATLFLILAYISIATVLITITLLYTIFWIIIFKKENSFTDWKSLGQFLIGGFATAMLQITILILLREWILG
jgi:uncharacterized membrane protein